MGALAGFGVLGLWALSQAQHARAERQLVSGQGDGGLETHVVRSDSLIAETAVSGVLEASRTVDVLSDVTGRVTAVRATEGDVVEAGAVLVEIDRAPFTAALRRAEAGRLEARGALGQADAEAAFRKGVLARAEALNEAARGSVTLEQLEEARVRAHTTASGVLIAQARLQQAEASVAEAEEQARRTVIRAPMRGRVVRVAVQVGEVAVPGTYSRDVGRLLTVADVSSWVIRAQVDSRSAVRLAAGQAVEVLIPALSDSARPARLLAVQEMATPGTTADPTYAVSARLDEPPTGARQGLPATVRLVVESRAAATIVPLKALVARPSKVGGGPTTGVFRLTANGPRFVAVQLGALSNGGAEVLRGLKQGDRIVSGPIDSLQHLLRQGAR